MKKIVLRLGIAGALTAATVTELGQAGDAKSRARSAMTIEDMNITTLLRLPKRKQRRT